MKKIADFFNKWGFVVFLNIVGVTLLFALGCCVYTAIKSPFVGIVGIAGVLCALAVCIGWISLEIRE